MFNPNEPFNQLPELPPKFSITENLQAISLYIRAEKELSGLKQLCFASPSSGLLFSLIPVIEAQASSEIENILTTNDELFRARALGDTARNISAAAKEANRYAVGLARGLDDLKTGRPLSIKTAKDVCSTIQGIQMDVRSDSGTRIANAQTPEVIYTPPQGKSVLESKLHEWEGFANREAPHFPLVDMAMLHYQFEAIHPFHDGNGRTGRILNLLYLQTRELIDATTLYLSGYINRTRSEYYRRLGAVTSEGDWLNWVMYMLAGIEQTAQWTIALLRKLQEYEAELRNQLANVPRLPADGLARLLSSQPYLRIDTLVEAKLCRRQAASKWLKLLEDEGILQSETIGKTLLFRNNALIEIIENGTEGWQPTIPDWQGKSSRKN